MENPVLTLENLVLESRNPVRESRNPVRESRNPVLNFFEDVRESRTFSEKCGFRGQDLSAKAALLAKSAAFADKFRRVKKN